MRGDPPLIGTRCAKAHYSRPSACAHRPLRQRLTRDAAIIRRRRAGRSRRITSCRRCDRARTIRRDRSPALALALSRIASCAPAPPPQPGRHDKLVVAVRPGPGVVVSRPRRRAHGFDHDLIDAVRARAQAAADHDRRCRQRRRAAREGRGRRGAPRRRRAVSGRRDDDGAVGDAPTAALWTRVPRGRAGADLRPRRLQAEELGTTSTAPTVAYAEATGHRSAARRGCARAHPEVRWQAVDAAVVGRADRAGRRRRGRLRGGAARSTPRSRATSTSTSTSRSPRARSRARLGGRAGTDRRCATRSTPSSPRLRGDGTARAPRRALFRARARGASASMPACSTIASATVLPDYRQLSSRARRPPPASSGGCSPRSRTRSRNGTRSRRSETGVRGFMQLTEETARHLGVADRLDPRASIGAARRATCAT